jgi:hypothetical protein
MNNTKLRKLVKETLENYNLQEETKISTELRNYIDSTPALKSESERIRLQDAGNKVILKYGYWKELPGALIKALELKYNVKEEEEEVEDEDGDTGTMYSNIIYSYEITPKKQMSELYNKTKKYLDEAKVSTISRGDKFTLSSDLGKFKKGEEIEIINKKPDGDDIKLTLFNGKVKDIFYLDKNDDI